MESLNKAFWTKYLKLNAYVAGEGNKSFKKFQTEQKLTIANWVVLIFINQSINQRL